MTRRPTSHTPERFDSRSTPDQATMKEQPVMNRPTRTRRRGLTFGVTGFAVAATLLAGVGLADPSAARDTYPFRDPGLPMSTRVDDLLGRLTLDEKIAMLHQYQPAIPRLGVGPFKTGTEALHGLAWSTDRSNGGAVVTAEATVFPQAI